MKKQTGYKSLIILVIILASIVPVWTASASTSNTAASLNWQDLSIITITGTEALITWDSATQAVSTFAAASNSLGENDSSSDSQIGWVSSLSAASVLYASTQGAVASGASLSSVSQSLGGLTYWSSGASNAILTGSFTADVDGWVIITVPYSISIDLTASNDQLASAYGSSQVSLSLVKTDGSTSTSTDSASLIYSVYNGGAYTDNITNGWLAVIKYFAAGETGTFTAELSTESNTKPVPIPGAILFLGSGCACLIGIRKRFPG